MAYRHGDTEHTRRLPEWLRRPLSAPGSTVDVEDVIGSLGLNTVCLSAKCPNRGECYSAGTATFLIMGDACTRACRFCAVETRRPSPLDPEEPSRVAEAASRLGLRHVVITSVTRDDLPDGGAAHFAETIRSVRRAVDGVAIEVLTSDFKGDLDAVDTVVSAGPDVFNHNVETVPRLYPDVRPQAVYARSLSVLAHVAASHAHMPVKSGLMLGLGETVGEVESVMDDLLGAGVDMLTLGQYLRPSLEHLPVVEFVDPSVFAHLSRVAYRKGFGSVASAPFVRSSYHAAEMVRDGDGDDRR